MDFADHFEVVLADPYHLAELAAERCIWIVLCISLVVTFVLVE